MDRPSIESVKAWARSRFDGGHHDPAPRLVANMGTVLGTQSNMEIAEPYAVQPSTVGHWRMTQRVPLIYLAPFLKLMSYDELAFGDLRGTRHEARGWTRDLARAASHGGVAGPVNITVRTSFEDVMGRLRTFFGEDDAFHEGVEATRNQMIQWKKRARVPDKVCRDVCDRHGMSMAWLMTGLGEGGEGEPLV